jgi:hypothetical protein
MIKKFNSSKNNVSWEFGIFRFYPIIITFCIVFGCKIWTPYNVRVWLKLLSEASNVLLSPTFTASCGNIHYLLSYVNNACKLLTK